MTGHFRRLLLLTLGSLLAVHCGVGLDEAPAMYQQTAKGLDLCVGCAIEGEVRLFVQPIDSRDPGSVTFDVEVAPAGEEFSGIPTLYVEGDRPGILKPAPGAYRWRARPQGEEGAWTDFAGGRVAFVIRAPPQAAAVSPRETGSFAVRRPDPPRFSPEAQAFEALFGKAAEADRPARAQKARRGALDPENPLNVPEPHCKVADSECRDRWKKSLTPAQRRWVKRYCSSEDNAFTLICGGTPLVIAFDSEPVRFTEPGPFALGPGEQVRAAWPSPETPWLAIDLDGNGLIDDARELFGSYTRLPGGERARDGFEALSALDSNGDGVVDARDPAFAQLLLWSDRDGDRRCSADELEPASSRLVSISLDWVDLPRCDERGNCERQRSPMRWRAPTGEVRDGAVVDVWLRFE